MTKKQLQYGVISIGVLILLVLVFSNFASNGVLSSNESVQLSSKQIQRSVNRSFPITHSNTRVNMSLKNPKVILKEGWEHVAIDLDLNMSVKKRRANRNVYRPTYNGKVTLSGSLAYSPKSGNISLKNIKLRILNSKKMNTKDIAKIEKTLVAAVQRKLNRNPIYRLKGKQFKHELNKMELSNIEINKNNINLELALK